MWGKDEDGCIYVSPFEHLHGDWVRHGDYARLHSQFANSEQENARLKAEVERLRKAGDAMADKASLAGCSECFGMYNDLEKSLDDWTAAKEGKPSA